MFILNSEPNHYSREALKILETIGDVTEKDCDRNELISQIPNVDILIVRLRNNIDSEVLSKATRLKIIVSATTGLNHIDLNAAQKNGVKVLSLQGESEFLASITATSELAWALLLSLYRRIPFAAKHVENGGWSRDKYKGKQLKDKTLGIVGFGRLGRIMSEYGKAFKMKVIAADPYVEIMPDHVEKVNIDELLKLSDIVTLHVNYNNSNYQMFDDSLFMKMKNGSIFLNTSRGELVDEKALIRAIDSKKLSGVLLDVIDNENSNSKDWLKKSDIWKKSLTNENIIIVPHIGGATIESMQKTEIFMAKKLIKFLQ
jgi:D-3-phosphoglycerate dehydrogenase / 2-oxoglutarate reductase